MRRDETTIRALLERLFIAMRTVASHGAQHPLALGTAEALSAAIDAVEPPFSLQFVADGVFCNRALVALDVEGYVQSQAIARAAQNLATQELSFDAPLGAFGALELATAFAHGQAGPSDDLEDDPIDGLRHREIDRAKHGLESEEIDREVAAVAHASLAVEVAETIPIDASVPWPWPSGLSTVRRLERAHETHAPTATYALELAPDGWTIGRRAASAAHLANVMLEAAGAVATTRRAAAHAVLILATQGLADRAGLPAEGAAAAALPRLCTAPAQARTGIEPHRLQATALVHAMAQRGQPGVRSHPALGAMHLAYELERMRRPERVGFDLTLVDLLARALRVTGQAAEDTWVRVLAQAIGVVPPGAWVALADGKAARVLGPGPSGDPFRPEVIAEGRRFEPTRRVRLLALHQRPAQAVAP